jgi:hypothetical protein
MMTRGFDDGDGDDEGTRWIVGIDAFSSSLPKK